MATMMNARVAAILAMSLFHQAVFAADPLKFTLGARDPGVGQWVSYEIVGPRNHPYPIVYISTEHFETLIPEFLIVLPQTEYGAVSRYTQSQLERRDCPGEKQARSAWYSVELVEHRATGTQRCVLPQRRACGHLSGLLALPGVEWHADERKPIELLVEEAGCFGTHQQELPVPDPTRGGFDYASHDRPQQPDS